MSRALHSWRLHRWTTLSLDELAAWVNPVVRGWLNYYGRFYRTALLPLIRRINAYILKWARKKYKRLASFTRAKAWWTAVTKRAPGLFAHWPRFFAPSRMKAWRCRDRLRCRGFDFGG